MNVFNSSPELADFKVFTASSAEEALDIIYTESIDAIVLDWMLPGISGLEVAHKLHEQDDDTPILMLTSISERDKVAQALKEGVKGYLVKPIVKDEFITRFLKIFN